MGQDPFLSREMTLVCPVAHPGHPASMAMMSQAKLLARLEQGDVLAATRVDWLRSEHR